MDDVHKKLITQNYGFLKTHLDVKYLLDNFIEKEIITIDQKDEILHQNPETRLNQAEKFLDILLRSGPNAYTVFLDTLQKTNNTFIADRIRNIVDTGEYTVFN